MIAVAVVVIGLWLLVFVFVAVLIYRTRPRKPRSGRPTATTRRPDVDRPRVGLTYDRRPVARRDRRGRVRRHPTARKRRTGRWE